MVKLDKNYPRTGDEGSTDLLDLRAYGDVDEANIVNDLVRLHMQTCRLDNIMLSSI